MPVLVDFVVLRVISLSIHRYISPQSGLAPNEAVYRQPPSCQGRQQPILCRDVTISPGGAAFFAVLPPRHVERRLAEPRHGSAKGSRPRDTWQPEILIAAARADRSPPPTRFRGGLLALAMWRGFVALLLCHSDRSENGADPWVYLTTFVRGVKLAGYYRRPGGRGSGGAGARSGGEVRGRGPRSDR